MTSTILVTDKLYPKTPRYLEKVRACIGAQELYLACVAGFGEGTTDVAIGNLVSGILKGTAQDLAECIRTLARTPVASSNIIGLNESSILPTLAIQQLLGIRKRSGLIPSCDKARMRKLLEDHPKLGVPVAISIPGGATIGEPVSATRVVVKPAFGMSSRDVKPFPNWAEAKEYAESMFNAQQWVPPDIANILGLGRTDIRVIEPFIEGAEFSIDGWLANEQFAAIVQHKLYMQHGSFIGDGVTVSPPIASADLPDGWTTLRNSEEVICRFGREVLDAVGFTQGVFHIEAREMKDGTLKLIEINPRAPGGSLWRSAYHRNGYDLEEVDAAVQAGVAIAEPNSRTHAFALHYPLYATQAGELISWGDFESALRTGIESATVDYVAKIGDRFSDVDLQEEPYLAFVVAYDATQDGILEKCRKLVSLSHPVVRPMC